MSDETCPERSHIAPGVAPQPSPVIVVDQGTVEARVESETTADFAPPSAWRLFLTSGSGRAGLVLFTLMLLISLWVLLSYPLDFGSARWSNPAYWGNNPRHAPPIWSTFLSGQAAFPQTVVDVEQPAETTTIPAGEVRLYQAPIAFTYDRAPTSLILTLNGLTFNSRAPAILVSLTRPDGGTIRLASVPVRGPRPGETAPYRRFYDVPERIPLTDQPAAADAVARFYAEQYPGVATPRRIQPILAGALFGVPASDGSGRIDPLHGDYRVDVQVVVANEEDELAPMQVTLGGTVFGIMGTDGLGRDLWEGLLYGFPVALLIATLTALLSTLIGASLGILSGFAGGATDSVIQRASDIISNVPTLPLLIFIVSILGRNLWLIMLVLVAFSWPGLTILVRSMVLQLREGQLVEAARAMGAPRSRIMRKHVFPQVAPFIVAQMIFFAPTAILAEASLSFLGLGDPSIPTWGQLLEAGFRTGALYVGYWWWVLPPGILIVITALAFMLLALALEPVVDPRLRRSG
ncbi:MAG TPA: ABC transporter permease [Thermomicrobiales bacterium]|nr:ABC transporter permease [Thermomicrobiales bacterium]